MNCIIVPTDFSSNSYNALELAKALATKSGGIIHLVHIMEPMSTRYFDVGDGLDYGLDEENASQLVKRIGDDLRDLKEKHAGVRYQIRSQVKVGDPFSEIKELVLRYNADLLVMGAKGIRNAKEFFLGSLTDKFVRSMPCPVISVKEPVEKSDFSNIVFPSNFDYESSAATDLLGQFQTFFDSKIHLLNVNTNKHSSIEKGAIDGLRRVAVQHRLKDYTLNCYDHEDEEYGVIYFSDSVKADLIVMGIHEKSGFRRLISGGSIAKKVSDHTFRPILTFPIKRKQ